MSENIKNKELGTDALQKVTGGVKMPMRDIFNYVLGPCDKCPDKDTVCSAYLSQIYWSVGGDGDAIVDVECPKGKPLLTL